MTETVWVAIVSSLSPIVATVATLLVGRSTQLRLEWRKDKLDRYEELLGAISALAIDGEDWDAANNKFAKSAARIGLVAPQDVVTALMAFHDEIKGSNRNRSPERHDELLIRLLTAIRRDMGVAQRDDPASFSFHLIGARPSECRVDL